METIFSFVRAGAEERTRSIEPKASTFIVDLFKFIRATIPIDNEKSYLKRLPLLKYEADISSMLHDILIVFF